MDVAEKWDGHVLCRQLASDLDVEGFYDPSLTDMQGIHTLSHIYIYKYTYIHIDMYIICVYMHTYIHACMHACMHAYIHTYIHTHRHTWVYRNKKKQTQVEENMEHEMVLGFFKGL